MCQSKRNKKRHRKNNQKIKESGLISVEKNIYICTKCGNAMKIERKLLVKNPVCRSCMLGKSFGEDKAIELLKNIEYNMKKKKALMD